MWGCGCPLRLRTFVACDSASLPSHICHLRLEKLIACDSSLFLIQTRKRVGWGGVGWDVDVQWHLQTKNGTQTLAHTLRTRRGVEWDVNVPWQLQTKNGTQTIPHIHLEQGVGWGVKVPWHLQTQNGKQTSTNTTKHNTTNNYCVCFPATQGEHKIKNNGFKLLCFTEPEAAKEHRYHHVHRS